MEPTKQEKAGSNEKLLGPIRYFMHWLIALPVPITAGTGLDQHFYQNYYGTILEGLAPCTSAIAAILGYLVNRKRLDRVAPWVFIPALFLFADSVYEAEDIWRNEHMSGAHLQFLVDNAFGIHPGCEGDCFGGLGGETLSISLAYSAGAGLALRRKTDREGPG